MSTTEGTTMNPFAWTYYVTFYASMTVADFIRWARRNEVLV